MSDDQWTASDPGRGDFDAELDSIDAALIERHPGDRGARLRLLVSVEGEDAARLERIAQARGKRPGEVVAELLRDEDRSSG